MALHARFRRAPATAASALLLFACAGAAPLAAQAPLTLKQAIDLAQRRGYQALAAVGTRDAARARDRAFGARQLPQISLNGALPSYNRSIIPVLQPDGSSLFKPQQQTDASLAMTVAQPLPFTGGSLTLSSSLAQLQVSGTQQVKNWSSTPFSVGLSQPILRPNALAWNAREQRLGTDVAERQYVEAREDIALQTTAAFFDFYLARMQLANSATNAAVNDTLYTLNKGRYEVGKIGENDLLQSELALLRARTSLDGARLEYDRSLAALRLALNMPVGAPLDIAVTAEVPEFEADTLVAVAQALRNRASIASLELDDTRARRRIAEAKLNGGPGAVIDMRYGFNATAPEAGLAYKNLLEAQRFSVQLQMPVIQWGARSADVQAAQADRDRVDYTSRATREQTVQTAHFAALQLAQQRRQLLISAKADTVAAKRFEVAYNRYVIGRIAIDNLFVAQTEKDNALQAYVSSLRGYWTAYYTLRRLTLYDFEKGEAIR